MACVVHVGDFIVRVFEYGFSGDVGVPYLQPEAVKILNLTPAQFEILLDHMCDQYMELVAGQSS